MLATKGYGLTIDDIDWSCPADMEPYIKAHAEYIKEADRLSWLNGHYMLSAVAVAIEKNFAKHPRGKYIEHPFTHEIEEKKTDSANAPLTEEEKKKQTEKLFMKLRIMGANFNLNKEK